MEREAGPAICSVLGNTGVGRQGELKRVEAVVVTGSAVGDVPGVRRVVKAVKVGNAVVEGVIALVEVNVSAQDKVDIVLEKDGLQDVLALPADRTASVRVANVPRSVAGYHDDISR
jgi:hypothetical protein